MKPTPTTAPADPVLLALLAVLALAWAVWQIARLLLVPAAALLLALAGWRPAPAAPAASEARPAPIAASEAPAPLPQAAAVVLACAPEPVAIAAPPIERLNVAQLRRLARAAGLPQLARSGRRAQLLEALAAA